MKKKSFLSITPVAPYDAIGHAGGKTYNYYLKQFSQKSKNQLKVLFFANKEELKKCDLPAYSISYEYVMTRGNLVVNIKHFMLDCIGRLIFRNPMISLYKLTEVSHYLKCLDESGQLPDVIELEWTNFVFFATYIKKHFPNVRIVASEHDVTYQSLQRKKVSSQKLMGEKSRELDALRHCDLVLVQSDKDKNLLLKDGMQTPILVISPYYHNMGYIERKNINNDILFWGAMYRPENYEAAIWFIEKVMPLLVDLPVRFVVAGNRPPECLKKYASDRVVITGFVEDETPLFESSMCFVSPLQTGAGIKVKVVEALSAGIPILTNTIGIEGIPAKNQESYFHCETPEEYAEVIHKIYRREFNLADIQEMQRKVIMDYFNLENSVQSYIRGIEML